LIRKRVEGLTRKRIQGFTKRGSEIHRKKVQRVGRNRAQGFSKEIEISGFTEPAAPSWREEDLFVFIYSSLLGDARLWVGPRLKHLLSW
jgi:hypothetical protein